VPVAPPEAEPELAGATSTYHHNIESGGKHLVRYCYPFRPVTVTKGQAEMMLSMRFRGKRLLREGTSQPKRHLLEMPPDLKKITL